MSVITNVEAAKNEFKSNSNVNTLPMAIDIFVAGAQWGFDAGIRAAASVIKCPSCNNDGNSTFVNAHIAKSEILKLLETKGDK